MKTISFYILLFLPGLVFGQKEIDLRSQELTSVFGYEDPDIANDGTIRILQNHNATETKQTLLCYDANGDFLWRKEGLDKGTGIFDPRHKNYFSHDLRNKEITIHHTDSAGNQFVATLPKRQHVADYTYRILLNGKYEAFVKLLEDSAVPYMRFEYDPLTHEVQTQDFTKIKALTPGTKLIGSRNGETYFLSFVNQSTMGGSRDLVYFSKQTPIDVPQGVQVLAINAQNEIRIVSSFDLTLPSSANKGFSVAVCQSFPMRDFESSDNIYFSMHIFTGAVTPAPSKMSEVMCLTPAEDLVRVTWTPNVHAFNFEFNDAEMYAYELKDKTIFQIRPGSYRVYLSTDMETLQEFYAKNTHKTVKEGSDLVQLYYDPRYPTLSVKYFYNRPKIGTDGTARLIEVLGKANRPKMILYTEASQE